MKKFAIVLAFGAVFQALDLTSVSAAEPPLTPTSAPEPAARRDPYKDLYVTYRPDFVRQINEDQGYMATLSGWKASEERMRLSTEKSFFTLNQLDEDSRANALVDAALAKEAQGQFRDAMKMYQLVIDKFPNSMYRISDYGVFVPISQYCQRRILLFPPAELAFYRSLCDARAKEAFEQARRQYSLIGLSEIVDTMQATSYGGRSLLELGNAALDSGYYLAALEYFTTIRDYFPDKELKTPELALKISLCRKMLQGDQAAPAAPAAPAAAPAEGKSELAPDVLARFRDAVANATVSRPPFFSQLTSPPHLSADDYSPMPLPVDPMALTPAVWQQELAGSRNDRYVFTQPVVTRNSVIYRHKNIVYCRSILTGELRWVNDMGGRAVWQNWNERQYPQEDVLVQDGRVFTTISKAGPSLVALDEVTGQLKWAFGPMVAANEEEARMRFESAPAGGPRSVFAGYVLDNIEGETHTDTEYGVIAFESATGRVQWRATLCRLAPGKFATGFAEVRRNRIRSFSSAPLFHEGTVYYNTNAGVVAAIDSQSGRIKWLTRYPYYATENGEGGSVHDATRPFGQIPQYNWSLGIFQHSPMLWYNQRPLLVGDRLIVPPVDTRFMFCIDRRTGQVLWSKPKGKPTGDAQGHVEAGGSTWVLGPTRQGQLVYVCSGRRFVVQLIDPADGKMTWASEDIIQRDDQPVMKFDPHTYPYQGIQVNRRPFELVARPFLDTDDNLVVPCTALTNSGVYGSVIGWTYHLTRLSLKDRKIIDQRRFYTPEVTAVAQFFITELCPQTLKSLQALPQKDEKVRTEISEVQQIVNDTTPVNPHGPFQPFSRVTFSRYGVPFDLRISPRSVQLVYDRDAVGRAIAGRTDTAADFARAELAIAGSRLDDAVRLLTTCLGSISSEDLDFRAAINQQLFQVHQRLARRAIRTGNVEEEVANALGMSRTTSTLAEEIETQFALAEAYERKGDLPAASRCLRTVIGTYGQHEYPISPLAVQDGEQVLTTAAGVLDQKAGLVAASPLSKEFTTSMALMKKGLPLYLSTVSPLPKTLTLRAGERAARQLVRLQQGSPAFGREFDAIAARELAASDKDPAEQMQRLWEFPATAAAQKAIESLCSATGQLDPVAGRQRLWRLADAARVCNLKLPEVVETRLRTPTTAGDEPDATAGQRIDTVTLPQTSRSFDFNDPDGAARLVLTRGDDRSRHSRLLFLGGRVRKKLDNKFTLACMDLESGQKKWERVDIRLKGSGQEPGFFEAFVVGDRVVVHGLYDVLAFSVHDGQPLWSYRVPFDFEIKHALLSGDLLILAGKTETLAVYIPTGRPNGEVAWQVSELGDIYIPPYMRDDRLISVRRWPFSVIARYRATGRLIGRLDLPDLSMVGTHPLLPPAEAGLDELPAAHSGSLLAVTDGTYYIMVDIDRLAIAWKRPIDANDPTRDPAMRFALSPDYLCVQKKDFDKDAIYMLSARTGEIFWQPDPKESSPVPPMHSMVIDGEKMFGLVPHAGQGYYLAAVECKTGKKLFRQEEVMAKDTTARPKVTMLDRLFGRQYLVTQVAVESHFELNAFDAETGAKKFTVTCKGDTGFGIHGKVSAAVQNGRFVLLSKDKLTY